MDKTTVVVAVTVHGCYNSRQNMLWFCQCMMATTATVVVALTIHGCYGQDNSCCSQDSAYGHYNQDNTSGRGNNVWLLWPRQQLLKPRLHGCCGQDNTCGHDNAWFLWTIVVAKTVHGHYNQDNSCHGCDNSWLLWPEQQVLRHRHQLLSPEQQLLWL